MSNKIIRMDQRRGEEDMIIRTEYVNEIKKAMRGFYQTAQTSGERMLMETLADCLDSCLTPGPKK